MTALQRAITNPPPIVGVNSTSPVAGLARRTIGFSDVWAQSISAVAPAAAATTIPVLTAVVAGQATLFSIAAATILCVLMAGSVTVFARRMSATGSLYTYVAKGLGSISSLFTGVSLLVGYGFIAMFALTGAGIYSSFVLGALWPQLSGSPSVVVFMIAAFAAVSALVLARGIRLSTRVTLIVEAASVAIILVLIVALLLALPPGAALPSLDFSTATFTQFAAGATVAVTAFVGFESATTLGAEARRPFASIPRAMLWTVLLAGGLYLLASYTQLAGFHAIGQPIGGSSAPVNDLASSFGVSWIGVVLDAGITMSFFACTVASTTALIRVIFSMAREGVVPKMLGRTDQVTKIPLTATFIIVPLLAVAPIATIALDGDIWLAVTGLISGGAAGFILAYVLVAIAVPFFLKKIGEVTLWPVIRAAIVALVLSVLLLTFLISESLAGRYSAVLTTGGIVAATGYLTLSIRYRRPWVSQAIGAYDETLVGDVHGGAPESLPVTQGRADDTR
jgi:amino acid transporter